MTCNINSTGEAPGPVLFMGGLVALAGAGVFGAFTWALFDIVKVELSSSQVYYPSVIGFGAATFLIGLVTVGIAIVSAKAFISAFER